MKINKHIAALLCAVAMTTASGALASPASASICGGWTTVTHTSSWESHKGWFKSHSCLDYTSSMVYSHSETTFEGDLGVNAYKSVTTLKDMTNGAFKTFTSDTYSWGENSTPSNAVRHYYPSASLPRIAGHQYSIWTWSQEDVLNDGKGTFYDSKSYTSWTAL